MLTTRTIAAALCTVCGAAVSGELQPVRAVSDPAEGSSASRGSISDETGLASGAVPEYHITDTREQLEALFPGNTYMSSQSRSLNQNGDFVGEVHLDNGSQHSFVYTYEHGLAVLPRVPGGLLSTWARDLTDRDEQGIVTIVGASVHGVHDYPQHAAIWRYSTVTGEFVETRNVGNIPGHDEGVLVAVNNLGIAVGYDGEVAPSVNTTYNIVTDTLEVLDFPARPAGINNNNEIIGGRYIGDLGGTYTSLATPPDCTSLTLTGINDRGWLVGRAGRPYSDGAGRTLASWVRFTDAGWHVPDPGSPWDTGFAINQQGDITVGYGTGWIAGVYIAESGEEFALDSTLPPELVGRYSFDVPYGINENQQIAAAAVHAVLLTPLGSMIFPGDVNGNAVVDLDDHCAWLDEPVDLNGDGEVDADDELWLIDQLVMLGFDILDCNTNGTNDRCDILSFASADCNANEIPDECEADCNSDGVPDECEADCNGNGVPDPCDIAAGFSADCNANGIPDECDSGRLIDASHSFDAPMPMFAGAEFTHDITLFDRDTIADIELTLDVEYRIGYLGARLIHNGVTITLIDRPGFPDDSSSGNGQLGYDIVLDDEGTGGAIEDQGNFGSPFGPIVSPPAYTPDEPLSAFDGMTAEGVWTLTLFTSDNDSPVLARGWHEWGLLITTEAVDVPANCGCPADLADPFGVLDLADVQAFIAAFSMQQPIADLDGNGVYDLADVQAFVAAFASGCP